MEYFYSVILFEYFPHRCSSENEDRNSHITVGQNQAQLMSHVRRAWKPCDTVQQKKQHKIWVDGWKTLNIFNLDLICNLN